VSDAVAHLDVDGARLAYRVDGPADAPPLALLHSLGTDLRMWDAQAAALARDFRVVRPDFRGHGGSDISPAPVTVERLGADVLALLDHLGVARAHLCGLSLGGVVALSLAARHPARVGRVVLANTGARIGSAESWDARVAAVRAGGTGALRDTVIPRWLSAGFRARRPDVARALGDMLAATPAEGYAAACLALRGADLRDVALTVRAPTLIIAGEADEATPPSLSEALHAAIAGSELLVLPGAAHLSNVELPDAFTGAAARFLAAGAAAAAR
jgi:3-oxoadipate enol-lactonase